MTLKICMSCRGKRPTEIGEAIKAGSGAIPVPHIMAAVDDIKHGVLVLRGGIAPLRCRGAISAANNCTREAQRGEKTATKVFILLLSFK
jgi:hypothetical protein